MKSFYQLSFQMTGGCYLDLDFRLGTLVEIAEVLEISLQPPNTIFEVLDGFDEIPLTIYNRGLLAKRFDLRPLLTIHCPDEMTYRSIEIEKGLTQFVSERGGTAFRNRSDFHLSEQEDAFPHFRVSMNWKKAEIPSLEEPILQRGEMAEWESTFQGVTYRNSALYGLTGEGMEGVDLDDQLQEVHGLQPDWLEYKEGVIVGMTRWMKANNDYSTMPILADSLEEAGCDNQSLLWHCRMPTDCHACGSWLVERILQSATDEDEEAD